MSASCDAGYAALAERDFAAARAAFAAALSDGESAEAWQGLAAAAWAEHSIDEALDARQQAYRAFRRRGDALGAARAAIWLGYDFLTMRGDAAIAGGFFARAHRLLDELPDVAERGWLALREGQAAMHGAHDAARALELAELAFESGGRHGDPDLELSGLSLRGLALVAQGGVGEGMRCLDAATAAALAGEVAMPEVAGNIYCDLIIACKQVRDYERAVQWCQEVRRLADRHDLSGLSGVCRAHHADVLAWHGEWAAAEQELRAASRDFERAAPAMSFQAGLVLAWLRFRQGQIDAAAALCDEAAWHPSATLLRAAIALEAGDLSAAGDLLERHERSLRAGAERMPRAAALELAVVLALRTGRVADADAAAQELEEIAGTGGSAALAAAALTAHGRVAAARGFHDMARRLLEDAVDAYDRLGSPYDAATARTELAGALAALGRGESAEAEWRRAAGEYGRLGAAARRDAVLALAGTRPAAGDLTPREIEVLRLVAEGLGDEQIAERLVLSPHTVHRHVANIRTKLRQPTRTAAATAAMRSGLI